MKPLIAFVVACLLADYLAYWVHRLQHAGRIKGAQHFWHHEQNVVRGWLREYWSYIRPSLLPIFVISVLLALWDIPAALGWLIGSVAYIGLIAYTHELYHFDPHCVFWVRRPLHHFHHHHDQRTKNFGVMHGLWDRVHGTWLDDPTWVREKRPIGKTFRLKWI